MKRCLMIFLLMLGLGAVLLTYASESSDQRVLKFQVIESKTLTKNDINALSMGRNDDGRYGVEIWLTRRFAKQVSKIIKANPGKQVRLKLNQHAVSTAVIESPLGSRFEIANLTQAEAKDILNRLSKDYSLDVN